MAERQVAQTGDAQPFRQLRNERIDGHGTPILVRRHGRELPDCQSDTPAEVTGLLEARPNVSVLHGGGSGGRGDGTFSAWSTITYSGAPSSLAVGDFNRDAILDLAIGGASGPAAVFTRT